MKLVCDTCGSKYSIDDSRVSGKAFKIRCKKCSGVILVRGAPAPVAEPVPDVRGWHVVLGGTQVGPMALGELQRRRAAGELDDQALVWREGFDDWRSLGTVEEVHHVAPPSVEVAPEALDAPAAAHPALRSERNETSVLFTLGNLAKLAAPAPATASPATGGEGSGLLDIRSLARTLAPAASASASRPARGSLDDLPLYASVAFVEPAVLVPGSRRGQDRRLVWALAASMGALAIVAALLVVIVLRGDGGTAHAATLPATSATPPAHVNLTPAGAPSGSTGAAAPAATAATPAAQTATQAANAAPAVASSLTAPAGAHAAATTIAHAAPTAAAAPHRAAARTSASPAASAAPATSRVESAAAPLTPPKRTADACTEVSCLVSGNADKCCEIYRDHAGSSPPVTALPDSLDRAALTAGIARIDTSGCHDQSPAHGDVTVSVRVSPAGAVTSVTVKSSPDAALGACVTAAAHKATFAATQRGASFAYVWRF